MADVPWESEEGRNYSCLHSTVINLVSIGLRKVFIDEWNSRYQASFGAWDDTNASGGQLFHREKSRPRPNKNAYQSKFLHGDTNQWDCSVLFDAILYSNSIGSTLNPAIKTAVDILRNIRNRIMHADEARLTDADFQTMMSDVENSFKALGISTDDITSIRSKRNLYKSFEILPPKPTHEVVIRSEMINEISQDLKKLRKDNDGKLTYFFISGNPGSGKSQLSRQLGEDFHKGIDWQENAAFIMTLNGKNLESLLHSYGDFCRHLNCDVDALASVMNSSEPIEVKIKLLRSQITTRIRNWKLWWIIVDNVEDLSIISSLLPQMGDEVWNNGQVILTIQNTKFLPSNSLSTKHISLSGGMNQQECRKLLSSLSGTEYNHPLLDEVSNALDHQPLALAAAAVYLKQLKEQPFSWGDYLEKLKKGKRRVTEEQLQKTSSAYSFTMSAAVYLAVKKCAENDFILSKTFDLFALICFEPLPIDIIGLYIQQLDSNFEKEEIYLAIKHCSLFLLNENDVRLHRVVHEASKLFCKCRRNGENYNSKYEILKTVQDAAKALYCFKDRHDKSKILPHLKSFNAVTELFFQQDLPASIGSLLQKHETAEAYLFFGRILRQNYQFQLALQFLNVSLLIWEDSDQKLSTVYFELADTHYYLGQYNKSKDYHERAMEIKKNVLGPNQLSYNNLGVVHQDMGELDQALSSTSDGKQKTY